MTERPLAIGWGLFACRNALLRQPPATRRGSRTGAGVPKNVGGAAKKVTMTLEELHETLERVRKAAFEEAYDAHERAIRIQNPRHPDCQMCDVLFEKDDLMKEVRVYRANVRSIRWR